MNETLIGYLSVIGAIIWFGSFALPLKSKKVQESQVDPVVFQIYYSFSIFVSSWLVLVYVPFIFTPYEKQVKNSYSIFCRICRSCSLGSCKHTLYWRYQ